MGHARASVSGAGSDGDDADTDDDLIRRALLPFKYE